MEPLIVIRRLPYEEPHHTQLEVKANNGLFAASLDFYCAVPQIAEIGRALQSFPTKTGDSYTYEQGSPDPAARTYRHFRLRAYTTDGVGHCAIQVTMNANTSEPNDGVAQFSMSALPAEINCLGDLLVAFSKLQHLELRWSPKESCLLESYSERAA